MPSSPAVFLFYSCVKCSQSYHFCTHHDYLSRPSSFLKSPNFLEDQEQLTFTTFLFLQGFIPAWVRLGPHTIVTWLILEQLRRLFPL